MPHSICLVHYQVSKSSEAEPYTAGEAAREDTWEVAKTWDPLLIGCMHVSSTDQLVRCRGHP